MGSRSAGFTWCLWRPARSLVCSAASRRSGQIEIAHYQRPAGQAVLQGHCLRAAFYPAHCCPFPFDAQSSATSLQTGASTERCGDMRL
ncbi:hypothetical protein N658DRAFT_495098 [Parathielavia hyrcaniae]|uniref:Uncharacterized protein n=1 Tax=Parathielavia hyrcaniae TaxID=113614 RepID=A0AAN6Q2H3_9PEZI|nr:hypothetical protein N658DRAFT_495098 [Parathielavia hyrcaniae]